MWPFYLTILIFLGVLILPFLVVFLLINFFAIGLANLGLSSSAGLLIVLAIFFGSFVNLPLTKKKTVKVRDRRLFGILEREIVTNQGLSINLGGAIIPVFIASILIPNAPFYATVISVLATTLVAYKSAKIIPGIGITMTAAFPVLVAFLLALLLAPESPEIVAFISGVLGTLIGADLLHLPQFLKNPDRMSISIGGAGVFDGIFLTGIVASLLAGI